jgi:ABC-type bacteriocin/lantibiotic exporter with double-glycine peptidase domain
MVFGFAISLPYLKPVLRPLRADSWREEWQGEACLQSTPSTCGPAAAATVVRRLGGHLSEGELAREAFTCRSGTENWYLARALRRHGFESDFLLSDPSKAPLPAIAGVRLRSLRNAGHFIALLERDGDKYVVADPMEGLSTNTLADLEGPYEFTGFFLPIRAIDSNR